MKSLQLMVLGVAMMAGAVAGCDGENTGGGYYTGGGAGPSNPSAGGSKAVEPGAGGVRSTNDTVASTKPGEATISCTISINGKLNMCLTAPGTAQDCTSGLEAGQSAEVVSKCPSEELLKCPGVSGNDSATLYLYDQATVDALTMQYSNDPCSAFE